MLYMDQFQTRAIFIIIAEENFQVKTRSKYFQLNWCIYTNKMFEMKVNIIEIYFHKFVFCLLHRIIVTGLCFLKFIFKKN